MTPLHWIYFWRGFWCYWLNREVFYAIENHFVDANKKHEKQAEILEFRQRKS